MADEADGQESEPQQIVAVAKAASQNIDSAITQARRLNRLMAIILLAIALSLVGVQAYRNARFSNQINQISTNQAANKLIFEQTQRDAVKTYTLVCDIAKEFHVDACPAVP